MKRCPQCRRDYYDETLLYCLDDGNALLDGPSSMDEPATAILTDASIAAQTGEDATRLYRSDPSAQSQIVPPPVASKRNSIIAGVIGITLITALGISSYLFYGVDDGHIDSIAVLPFQNRSGDPDSDYLSDGLAETLIFRLSQLPGLKVSPTSSVLRYKGKDADSASIAKELGVDAVMSGRLVQRGDSLNISVELIDARDNKLLWGEQFERKLSELLATQREIAATIAQKLQLKLAGDEKGVNKGYTDSSEAYQLYLKGRFHFARRTKEDMQRCIELLQQATEIDPNFALAYVGIAESYTSMPSYPYMSPMEASPKALTAISKALAIDPDLPEAHAVAAMIATTDQWDYATADREFRKAIELGPNLAITHYRYGWTYLSPLGRHEEAIAEMKRAMELEPLALQQGANYAAVLMYARRFDEAVVQARKTYELDPNHVGARNWLCYALNANGQHEEALRIAEAAFQVDPTRMVTACLGIGYAKTGQREKALEVIAKVKEGAKQRYAMTYWVAAQYAALGDKDAAFAELETSFKNRDWFLPRLKVDPFMDPLRDDPRFDEMIKRLNLPQ